MGIARSQMNRQLYAVGTFPRRGIQQLQQPMPMRQMQQTSSNSIETMVGDAVKMVVEATGMGIEAAAQAVGRVLVKLSKINPEVIRTGGPRVIAMETMKELSSGKPQADEEVMSLMKGLRPQASNEEFMTEVKDRENLLAPGEDAGEGYTGAPDMYPDYAEDAQEMANGGIMSLNRQGYFLGGIGKAISGAVKGVTKAVKGIVSSDIGKLALTAAAIYAGGGGFGLQPGGFSLFGNAAGGAGLLGSGGQFGLGESFLGQTLGKTLFGQAPMGDFDSGVKGLFGSYGKQDFGSTALGQVASGASKALPYVLGGGLLGSLVSPPKEEEKTPFDQSKQVADWTGRIRERLRGPWDYSSNTYKNYNPIAMAANGGRIGYAYGSVNEGIMAAPQISSMMGMPVGNPRQNQQGVAELDYRDQGGFVPPIGVKERADDIPAMLSNNEFVFTADAVKNAGGGDTNVGAQRMYAMMKKLENGGVA